jgi:Protein of unknown function (DUF2934)
MRQSRKKMLAREDIARRAYEIYLQRGGGHGRDFDDWIAAEKELSEARERSGLRENTERPVVFGGSDAEFARILERISMAR